MGRRDLNWWLIRGCAVLILWDLIQLAVSVASIPRYIQRAGSLSIVPYQIGKNAGVSNAAVLQAAAAHNMMPSQYAIYQAEVAGVFAAVLLAVGLVVLARARGQWFVWMTAHVMLSLTSFPFYRIQQVALLVPKFWIEIGAVSWPLFVLYFFLFPNGKAVPRWLRPPLAVYCLFHLFGQLYAPVIAAEPTLEPQLGWWLAAIGALQFIIFVILPLCLGSQIYRYLRVSTQTERLQMRSFLFGFALFVGATALNSAVNGSQASSASFANEVALLAMLFLPVSLAVAVLRYRLWDVDHLIRRTLVYAAVTALLALVFYGSIISLQRLFTGVTGQQSPVVLVVSTLAIAALFSPLRRRVQDFVDRRFYRRKYDAQQVLDQFATVARDETDLARLTGGLTGAVSETVQPEKVAVWLRPN